MMRRAINHAAGNGHAAGNATASQREWLLHMAQLPVPRVYDELNAHAGGLAPHEVEVSRELWGPNVVAHADRKPRPIRLLLAFSDPLTYILVLIAAVSVLTDWIFASADSRGLTTPAIIGVMVLVSGVMRFVQEERSGDAAESLAEMIETTCCVLREGPGRTDIPLDEVVVGDVVNLSSGDIVPADLRIVHARDLFVSQSSLTGEPEPVEKVTDAGLVGTGSGADAASDVRNLAFMGSTVISGTARGVVVATGARTLFGEATSLLGTARRQTAADEGVSRTSVLLVRLMMAMVPVVLLVSGMTKGDWLSSLLFSLSVAVGLTPEMLPMLVSGCLGKGALDLSREHVIVKRLGAIQDLGAIDILCTDKTGTLTQDSVVLERHLDVDGNEDVSVLNWAFMNSFFGTGMRNLIDSAIIRRATEEGARGGGPTGADEIATSWQLVDELPFDFERRRVSVVVGDERGNTVMVTKGAMEEVLALCSQYELSGERHAITPDVGRAVMERAAALGDEGMRVLGVAVREEPAGAGTLAADDECDMTLIGYLAFLDPPKASAAEAVRALAQNGVTTKVLTGDSARVTTYVCGKMGLPVDGVLTGAEVDAMDDAELAERAQRASVFAKLSPTQKARVVQGLRSLGHAVGYMGDGVNDAAAMRASDCGISVDSAVDVAREAADIILLEKDLMVLERGIMCGRRTYANMAKYVKITVSSNFGNVISVLVAATFLPFLPMTAVQLLLLNLIYDLTCTAIPWDNVDDELVLSPRRWDGASMRAFMLRMGPVSSVFDLITFAALFAWICPAAAGGAWGSLDASGRALFVSTFQAGWFVESMWTQTLVVHLVRTARVPFVQSHAAWSITLLGASGIVLATLLPATAVGGALGFAPMPTAYFVFLACVVAGYVASALLARRAYLLRHHSLL